MAKKTDNHNPEAKLKLRRHFLEKYHSDGSAKVFDCCQGGGIMWTALRRTHSVASYWGVDVKPKKGRVKIDSVRVLQQPGLKQDVIDIDTYGSPWKHWFAVLPNIVRPTTVFLTIGTKNTMPRKCSAEELALIGCTIIDLPAAFSMKLQEICTNAMLSLAVNWCTIIETQEAPRGEAARYIGIRLEPKSDRPLLQAATCQQTQIVKGS